MARAVVSYVAEFVSDFVRVPFYVDSQFYVIIGVTFVLCQALNVVGHWFFSRYSVSYRALPYRDQKEWQTRIASTAHAALAFVVALYVILFDHELSSNPVFHRSYLPSFIAAVAAGYFASDFLMIVLYRIPPLAPIIAHHFFCGVGMFGLSSQLGKGTWFAMVMLLNEGSTPFNNIHWMMERTRLRNTRAAQVVGYMFAVAWFLVRVAINPYIVYKVVYHWDHLAQMGAYASTMLFGAMVFLMCLNTFWFFFGPFRELVFGPKRAPSLKSTMGVMFKVD